MEKLSKTAKTLDTIMKVVFWLLIVMSGILTVYYSVRWFVLGEFYNPVDLGNVTISFLPEYQPEGGVLNALLGICTLAIWVVGAVGVCFMIKITRSILKPMIEGVPFSNSVSADFKKLGIIVLVFGIIGQAAALVCNILTFASYDMEKAFNFNVLENVDFMYNFDVGFIFTALVLFLLSFIFRYGAELQKLSDETL